MLAKNIFKLAMTSFMVLVFFCQGTLAADGPQLGKFGSGAVIDKSRDGELQKLVKDVAPRFRQLEFASNGKSMPYNLFAPEKMEAGAKYPLVLFMADATTPGTDAKSPLTQGYGALVFASPESQAKNPCYVLVPQFSGIAVNDAYERSPEVEMVLKLLEDVVKNNAVDPTRIYATGQSMGGMISMYYNIAHPGIFAASLFVDCHWDKSQFDKLVEHPFIFIYAGTKGKAYQDVDAIENAARKMSKGYTWAEWSAKLPEQRQNELAATYLEKGQPINIFGFENGSVLPENVKGPEHLYSFDHAYKLAPARDWLFIHTLENGKAN